MRENMLILNRRSTNKENAKQSGCGTSQIQRIISRQIKIARNQGRQPKEG